MTKTPTRSVAQNSDHPSILCDKTTLSEVMR